MQGCNPGQSRFVAWSPVHKHPDSPPGQSKPLDQNGRCAEGRNGQEGLMIWLRLQLLLPCTSIPPEHRLRPNLSSCRMTLVGQLDYCPILSQEITFTRLNFRLKGEVHARRASIGGWDKLHQRLSTRASNIINLGLALCSHSFSAAKFKEIAAITAIWIFGWGGMLDIWAKSVGVWVGIAQVAESETGAGAATVTTSLICPKLSAALLLCHNYPCRPIMPASPIIHVQSIIWCGLLSCPLPL